MRIKAIAAAACTVALSASLLCGLSACSSESIAATVGSKNIPEQEITDYIADFRVAQGMEDDSNFALVLAMYGMTPSDFRESIIDMFVNRELVLLAAEEKGLSVDSDTIDGYVNQIRANYSDDASWQTALKNAGLTEQEYRDNIEYTLLHNQLIESFAISENPSDEEVFALAKDNLKYFANAKRSSHILFNLDDEETAQEVLARIKDGSLDFAEAAALYSEDGSGADGGDVGWDLLTSFVTEYQEALDGLSQGQVSDLVESQYGYHIILCTETIKPVDEVQTLADLPEAFQDFFRELASTNDSSTAFTTWLNGYKTTVAVKINPMPAKLPYDVDMSTADLSSLISADSVVDTEDAADTGSAESDASSEEGASAESGVARAEGEANSESGSSSASSN